MANNFEVTVTEAAKILGCNPRSVRYMITEGTIKARTVKVDPTSEKGEYRIQTSEIERIQRMLEEQNATVRP